MLSVSDFGTRVDLRLGTYNKLFFFLFFFSSGNAKYKKYGIKQMKKITLFKFLIELSSKFVGVGITLALLQDN